MIQEFDVIALTVDLPNHHLKVGDTGTVVDIPPTGDVYVVEFITLLGKTLAVVEVSPSQIRLVTQDEVANARLLIS